MVVTEHARKDLTYNGKAFFAVGDFSLTSIGRTFSIYYDKVYAESYQLPDMYQLVRDGKWTIDKLSELTKDVYTDLNNDGKRDFEDFYRLFDGGKQSVRVSVHVRRQDHS